MRKAITIALTVTALAVPSVNAWASAATQKTAPEEEGRHRDQVVHRRPGSAGRWGDVQVTIVVKKTTTTVIKTKQKTVDRKITSVKVPVFPNHTDRSMFINQQALPYPGPGDAAGSEHGDQHGLGRDRHEPRLPVSRCSRRSWSARVW